jgi:cell division protein FtsZ
VTLHSAEKKSSRTPAEKNKELESVLGSHQTRILVVGCGGGGNNTITRLMEVGVKGVSTLSINTDAQDLLEASTDDKILIGRSITKGLGAGSNPQIGEDAARENQQEVEEALKNNDMVFVTCGLGGGTGTGSAPVVAETAKRLGALTIAVVTMPFTEEGVMRWENAHRGLNKLRQHADTVIVIQNDRLLETVPDMPLGQAFKVADEILVNAVRGITELITEKGLVNLDFADVRTIMQNGGTAMIGIGEGEGGDRARIAIERAMQNQLLDVDITGAKSALINVAGGAEMSIKDSRSILKIVAEKLDPAARIIWGARIDESLGKSIRVMLIVSGLPEKHLLVGHDAQTLSVARSVSAPAFIPKEQLSKPDGTAGAAEAQARKAPPVRPNTQPNPEPLAGQASKTEADRAATPSGRVHSAPAPRSQPSGQVKKGVAPPAGARAPQLTQHNSPQPRPIPREGTIANSRGQRTPQNSTPRPQPPNRVENTAATSANNRVAPQPQSAAPTPNRTVAGRNPGTKGRFEQLKTGQPASNGNDQNIANQPASTLLPVSMKKPEYGKFFQEETYVDLRVVQQAVAYLMSDPAPQETLRTIQKAAARIKNKAQTFAFAPIVEYAASVETLCARAANTQFKITEKFVDAFMEISTILVGMILGDSDAFAVAERHQEKLQRLAESFAYKTVSNPETNTRQAKSKPNLNSQAATARSQVAVKKNATETQRTTPQIKPVSEVMDYLNNLFPDGKASSKT